MSIFARETWNFWIVQQEVLRAPVFVLWIFYRGRGSLWVLLGELVCAVNWLVLDFVVDVHVFSSFVAVIEPCKSPPPINMFNKYVLVYRICSTINLVEITGV